MTTRTIDADSMPGTLVREGHRRTVLSIVGRERMLPVQSSGTRFYMRGPFGWRTVANRIASGDFDPASIAAHVEMGRHEPAMINVAQCDETVSRRVYMAMVGGAAHEAFHRVYSQQGTLLESTIRAALAPVRANPGVNWAKHRKLILDLQNVFEDVVIERVGCAEYPGVATKMADLADFIVKMERDSRANAGQPVNAVSAVFITLRDAGLGYNTEVVRANLADIKRECPEGFALVAKGGALHDILRRSIPDVSTPAGIARAKQDLLDGSALTLALEAVAILDKLAASNPENGQGEGDQKQPQKGQKGEGKGEDSDEGEPGEGEGKGEPGEGRNEDSTDGESANGAGGGAGDSKVTAKDVLDQHAQGANGSMDSNTALEAGLKAELSKEPVTSETAPWRPYSTSHDEIVRVKAQPSNAARFTKLAESVRASTVYLRTRLSVIFRALEEAGVEHGVRKGPALSGRMLVNSHCEMKGGSMPTRAYLDRTPAIDMSIAAALVIDESSSMDDKLRETAQVAYTLMDALDSIGAKSMAVGFRTGRHPNHHTTASEVEGCHRTHGMVYDLFKDWSETFKSAAPRLGEIKATGGTPLSDGLEFALRELSGRTEGHRVVFVLTDGQPDYGHHKVLRSQLQRAAEAGILVVGVGLGYGSEYVQHTFPESVYAGKITALPKLLVAKLETLVKTRHGLAKRGKAVRAA